MSSGWLATLAGEAMFHQKQISCGDDSQKGKGKGGRKATAKGIDGLLAVCPPSGNSYRKRKVYTVRLFALVR
jgi:hypothetical protein